MDLYAKAACDMAAPYGMRAVGAGGESYPANSFVIANETLDRVHALARRVESLADRLVGPVPTSAGKVGEAPVSGLFDAIRGACISANSSISDANDALDRIERALP